MSLYNMSDTERQILINQYEILKNFEVDEEKIEEFEKKISYLKDGYIVLYEKVNYLRKAISKEVTNEVLDILDLHGVINYSAKLNNTDSEKLYFDPSYDQEYWELAKQIVESGEIQSFNDFKVEGSHGVKNINDHRKQLAYWKNVLKKKANLSTEELKTILDYESL